MRYLPAAFGGLRIVRSSLLPDILFEKQVALKENHVPEGQAARTSMSKPLSHGADMKPSQLNLQILDALVASPGTQYRER